jgi:glycosyltransferase 2 family protein
VTRLLGSRAVRLGIAIALTTYLLWKNDPSAIVRAAAGADWRWIGFACGLVLFDRALMAWRWLALLRPVTPTALRLGAIMRVFFVSSFVGTFLPASVGGDAVRAYGVMRHDVAGSAAVASVAMDRALGVVSVLLLGLVSALTLSTVVPMGVWALLAAGGAISLAAAAVIFVDAIGDGVGRLAVRLPGDRLRHVTQRVLDAVRAYRHHHGALAGVLAASVAVQALRVLQAWGLGRALGIEAPLAVYFVAIPICVLIMQVPITVSGLGTGQAAFLWTLAPAGVARPEALALSILFIALGIVGNLPGGFLYIVGSRR